MSGPGRTQNPKVRTRASGASRHTRTACQLPFPTPHRHGLNSDAALNGKRPIRLHLTDVGNEAQSRRRTRPRSQRQRAADLVSLFFLFKKFYSRIVSIPGDYLYPGKSIRIIPCNSAPPLTSLSRDISLHYKMHVSSDQRSREGVK